MTRRSAAIFCCVWFLAWAAAAGRAAAPGRTRTAGWDDAWLGEAVLGQLDRAAQSGRYAGLAERIEAAALARLACGDVGRLRALNDMVYALRACRALAPVHKTPADRQFVRWLLAHAEVSRLLFRAVGEVENPAESLARLRRLVSADEKAVLAYADLAVAFVTSVPSRHTRPQPQPASMIQSFQWYTDPKLSFRCDLKKLPYEVLRHLADTRLSLADRRWAMKKYGRSRRPSKAYFHVRYDRRHFRKGKAKKISAVPYTLANLRRVGGVCVDQAYYASEVCKALGIPATIVFGRGGAGVPHSWFAYVRARVPQRASWNCRTGRYAENKYFIGWVRDPAGGADMVDSVLALQGRLVQLPLRRREEADAAVALARLVRQAHARGRKADLSVLRSLARAYDSGSPGPKRPLADTRWLKLRRPIDLQLVNDLIGEALARNLAHPPAWDLVIELRKSGQLSVRQFSRLFNSLFARTSSGYADFSYILVTRVMPTVTDFADRRKIYDRALGLYKSRPDLRGRILIALGDDHRRQDKADEALACYRRAAEQCVDLAEIVIKAARRAEELLLERDRRGQAISMYRRLWAKTKKEDVSEVYLAQTSHWQLGLRLAGLLDAAGQKDAARSVRKAIGN